jgi:hypothetical protein
MALIILGEQDATIVELHQRPAEILAMDPQDVRVFPGLATRLLVQQPGDLLQATFVGFATHGKPPETRFANNLANGCWDHPNKWEPFRADEAKKPVSGTPKTPKPGDILSLYSAFYYYWNAACLSP